MEYDITNIVVGALIGVGLTLLGLAWYVWIIISKYEKEIQEHVRGAVKQVEQALMPVIVEQDGEEIFVYAQADRQFLVQGRSAKEIRERFDLRFPDRIAYMAGGDENLIARLKQELKEIKAQEKSEVSHSI